MSNKVRVRFAPSPTGPLHIGGLRTALFNYLFAKKNKGDFIIRIEDTDQNRYVAGSEKHILDSLSWCGITPDEGPYRQSERGDIYKNCITKLVSLNGAYYAFDTKEELETKRKDAEKNGKTFIYNASNRLSFKNSLSLEPEETQKLLEKSDYTVRFKTPENGSVTCYDVLRGKVVVEHKVMDDKVLFKNDGTPTYHFANVVDDFVMEISHVIRGEEWLPSLALHWLLYEAFGWKKPKFIHLPLILKPTGKGKLSKRDGDRFGFPIFPVKWKNQGDTILGYKENGFLPGATLNFLALLGWNPGTEKEIFTLKQLENEFSLKKLNNSGARFDPKKNVWFNQQHIQELNESVLMEALERQLAKEKIPYDVKKLPLVIDLIRPRLDFMTNALSISRYFFAAPQAYDKKALKKLSGPKLLNEVEEIISCLENCENFNSKKIKSFLEVSIRASGSSFGKILGLVRLAIIGELSGADLFQTMELIGKVSSLKRLRAFASFIA